MLYFFDFLTFAQSIRMLQLEIEMLKTLSHERIVQYYGTIMSNDELYIFVEYMPGVCLFSDSKITIKEALATLLAIFRVV